MLSIAFKSPDDILNELGERAKAARLALGWTRQTLAERSGIPESTLKRFENTGRIGTAALVNIAIALDMTEELGALFSPKPVPSVRTLRPTRRMRGSV